MGPLQRGQHKDRDPLGKGGREVSSKAQEYLGGSKPLLMAQAQSTLRDDENLSRKGLQTFSSIKVSRGERSTDKAPRKKAGNMGSSGTGFHMLALNLWTEWKTRKEGGYFLRSGSHPAANCKGIQSSLPVNQGTGLAAG